jgi:hypothetical protein
MVRGHSNTGATMQGSLGQKIGEGAFSEAYAWAPGQVVKLFKPGVSRWMPWFEVRMLRAVLGAGVPVPEVFGEKDGNVAEGWPECLP